MKKALFPMLVILGMILSLSGPMRSVQASNPFASPDVDQDGLSNTMELNGWYNLAGGPYVTNPSEADTDHTGLTDGQKKLFNINPTDPHSPGIAVLYQNSYNTFEYYNAKDPAYHQMVQGRNQYQITEGAVIRRGTTFKINAVNTSPAVLTVTGAGLTPLSAVPDIARGGWWVTVPPDGTVGTYTATITDGAWSKSMPIYVIFEIPTDMSQADINAFLYDGDPANKRDEVAVVWRSWYYPYYNNYSTTPTACMPADPICSNWPYHVDFGYAQAFWTEQFTKNVLINFTMPVIQGATSQYAATQAIAVKADASVRVNYARLQNSFSSATAYYYDPVLGYGMAGGACETNTGVFTSMLRSVGIPARPFNLDYNRVVAVNPGDPNPHGELGSAYFEYDHAVMMWIKGLGDATNIWYADRTSSTPEPEYEPTPNWTGGTSGLRPLADVGIYNSANPALQFAHFQNLYADLIQTTNSGWDWQNGSMGGGMVNTVWGANGTPDVEFYNPAAADPYLNRDYKWDSQYPLQMQYQSPYVDILNCQLWKGDNWAPIEWMNPALSDPAGRTAQQTYDLPAGVGTTDVENWPYNPIPLACSPSAQGSADCTKFLTNAAASCVALPGQTLATPSSQSSVTQPTQPVAQTPALNSTIQIGSINSVAGLDQRGNGRFNQLVVKFDLNSAQAGQYQLGGWLQVGSTQIPANVSTVTLTAGHQTVQISFDGQLIGDNHVNGPYTVGALWAAPAGQAISQLALPEEMTAYQTYNYASQAFQASDFTVREAYIGDNFSYSTAKKNAAGLADSINISVPLSIAISTTFKVEGDLYDGQGGFVGHAEWTGTGSTASLQYTVKNTQPPYSLEHLNLLDSMGKVLDARYAPVYTINDLGGKIAQGNAALVTGPANALAQSVTPTNLFTVTPVDSNANGLYNQLVVSAGVNVTVAGSYWMEGLLVDSQGQPVAWSVGDPQTLAVGQNQTIQMPFDGGMIFDQLPLTGNMIFTLTAVKIFSGTPGSATVEADVPIPGFNTPAYTRSQFDSSSPVYTLFQDDMESGAAKWNTDSSSQWSLKNSIWHSFSNAWIANGSATSSGLLSFAAPLDLTNYASPWLKFFTSYQLADGQSTTLEVSTDSGAHWTIIQTYTGSTEYWTPELVDLSAYGKTAGVMIRFNAQNNPGIVWSIDDVFVDAGPVINSASFIHSVPVRMYAPVTFTASYVSSNHTLPVLYKWDFCGVTKVVSTPAIVYQFTTAGNCSVSLTVDNSYDSAAATPKVVSVGQSHLIYMPAINKP